MSLSARAEVVPAPSAEQFSEHIRVLSRQSLAFFAGTIFTTGAGYLFKVYLARRLGADALGIYALGMTIIGFMGLLNGPGLHQAAVRFVATYVAQGQSEYLRSFLVRSTSLLLGTNVLLSSLVVVFGPSISEQFYHTKALDPYLSLFALIMFFSALTTYFGQILVGYKDVLRRTAIANFVGTPLMMGLTIVLIAFGLGLWGYIFAQVVAAFVVVVLLLQIVWKLTPPAARRLRGQLLPLRGEVWSFSAAAFGIGALEFLLAQVDKILIGFYITVREVGIYAVVMAIVAFVPIALQSVNQIFAPTIADLHSRGERELLGRLFQSLTKSVIGFTLPLTVVLIVFARPVVNVFGPDFTAGWPVLVIGVVGQLVNCATGSVGYLLLMSGNQKKLLKVQATMTAVMIIVNIIAIPHWGITGAAAATALATIGTNLWSLHEVRVALGLSPYNSGYLRLLPAAAVTTCALLLLRHSSASDKASILFLMIAGICAYAVFAIVAYSIGLEENDRVIVRALWLGLREAARRGYRSAV